MDNLSICHRREWIRFSFQGIEQPNSPAVEKTNRSRVRFVDWHDPRGSFGGQTAGQGKDTDSGNQKRFGLWPQKVVCRIANSVAELLRLKGRIKMDDVELNGDYVGEDFGVPTEDGTKALRPLWRLEGILLEPVYTAKAMAGLIDLAGKGIWKQRVIFLHTGGTPTTFSFAETLSLY